MTSDQDRRLAEIVEVETDGLAGDADALARMRATVARIAEAAILAGTDAAFRGRARKPGATDGTIDAAIRDGRQGAHGGRALPPAAALWPSEAVGTPGRAETLPRTVRWIADPQEIANTADFTLGAGPSVRRFRFFERVRASDDGPAYVSALTETGVPAAARRGRRRMAWFLGILASAMFLFATISIAWTGRTLVEAYTLLVQPDTYRTTADAAQKPATLVAVAAARAVCAPKPDETGSRACPEAWQNPEIRAAWRTALGDAMPPSSAGARGIDTIVPILGRTLGFSLARVQHAPGLSLGLGVGMFVGSIVLLAVALGLGTSGNVFGIWIGPQNRVSLASFQVSLWTAALLGPYAAYVFFNAALIGGSLRETLSGVFPSIPYPILGALGISVAGAELAGVVKVLKEGGSPSSGAAASAVQRVVEVKRSDLARNTDPSQASLAELFLGETEADRDRIDLARLQNVIITLILVFGYLMALFGKVHLITHEAILTMLSSNQPLVASLPDPDASFLTLLIASHAAYLYAKAKAG